MGTDDWIGTPDAAARLGITVQQLYRLIDTGRLPAYRFGRIIRLRVAELEAFAETFDSGRGADPAPGAVDGTG